MRLVVFLLVVLFPLILVQSYGQTQTDSLESVYFAKGSAARRCNVIINIQNLLETKNYNSILDLLESNSLAERFMGVIVSEMLAKDGKINLNESQKLLIKNLKGSQDVLVVEYGCVCYEKLCLADYFNKGNPCHFKKDVKRWKMQMKRLYY